MRKIVIGDIHGGLKALVQLLERIVLKKDDKLIFVGDYVDGWSESAETISYLIELSQKFNCVFIRGNHDELLYNYLKQKNLNDAWLQHGGVLTIKSYSGISENELNKHIEFLENLENYVIDDDNILYVHAGFTNIHGPQQEYFPNLVYWDRTLWEMACSLDASIPKDDDLYPKRLQLFKEIFIGHTPVTRIGKDVPTNFANVWNTDTGAAFQGRLSAIDVDTKQIWQSDPVWKLYPEERGRN